MGQKYYVPIHHKHFKTQYSLHFKPYLHRDIHVCVISFFLNLSSFFDINLLLKIHLYFVLNRFTLLYAYEIDILYSLDNNIATAAWKAPHK